MKRLVEMALCGALLLGAAGILAGCGKKGAPEAPGPGDKITYPRTYPAE